ncbi:MAG: bacteriohemerythrin [Methylococcaceae bacterium]|nr:bacteriohemerythrin [Methylococcaceae bacterium]
MTNIFEVFPWNDNFETKIPLIDEQHKELVLLLNKLASHLANQADALELNSVFDELADYADYHFKSEEMIWKKYFSEDAWYAEHEKTHHSFIAKVLALKAECQPLDVVISDIIRFLTHWLAYHILNTDRRMAITVLAIDSGMSMQQAKNHSDITMSDSIEALIDTVMMMYDSLSTRTMELMREKTARLRAEAALKLNEDRWNFIMESSGDEVWDWDVIQGEVYRSDNSLAISNLFSADEKLIEQSAKIHPDDLMRVRSDLQRHIEGKTEHFINEHRVLNQDGSCHWVLTRGKVISRSLEGEPLRMIGTHINITERDIGALLYQNSSEGMIVSDANGVVITVNPAFTTITGYTLHDVVGQPPKMLGSENHDRQFYQAMWRTIKSTGHWQGEIWSQRKNDEIYPGWLTINSIYNPDNSVHYRIGLLSDITDRKLGEEVIWKQANFDQLTELPNRQMFYDRFTSEVKAAHREQKKLALLFIDLDRFKEVNDSLGHSVGDALLVEVAERLNSCVRETDLVARLGGDEFTILLCGLDSPNIIMRIVQDILQKVQTPFVIGAELLYVSASIGITLYPDDGTDRESLLRNADQAMYQAKSSGRNRSSFFTQALQDAAQNRMRIANELRDALSSNQLQLFYQPIVTLATGNVHKAEALIRWQHPDNGLVSPDAFISIAEDTGMIHEIGDWVFSQAAQQVAKWRALLAPDFQISINKSPVQFQVINYTHSNWFNYLKDKGIDGDSIIIEITEGLLLDSSESVQRQLDEFSRAGMQVSLDDFGTGFSSLAYLQKFDIDYIKIDKSFVQKLTPTSKNLTLCKAMIMMAHALDIEVVAEGIETEQQKELLTSIACDYGQGYLFSKPIDALAFEQLFAR